MCFILYPCCSSRRWTRYISFYHGLRGYIHLKIEKKVIFHTLKWLMSSFCFLNNFESFVPLQTVLQKKGAIYTISRGKKNILVKNIRIEFREWMKLLYRDFLLLLNTGFWWIKKLEEKKKRNKTKLYAYSLGLGIIFRLHDYCNSEWSSPLN